MRARLSSGKKKQWPLSCLLPLGITVFLTIFPQMKLSQPGSRRVDEVRLITLTLFTIFFTSTSRDSEHRQEVFSFCSVGCLDTIVLFLFL